MDLVAVLLILALVTAALVAGLVFTFAVVVMPGIAKLGDRDFVRAFQAMDGIIQAGSPAFAAAWLGSIASLGAALVVGLWSLSGGDRALLVAAALLWALAVQLPTFRGNLPLNAALQAVDAAAADAEALAAARARFEGPWRRWNALRTAAAVLAVALLGLLLLRL